MNIETALADIEAKFDEIMAAERGEEEDLADVEDADEEDLADAEADEEDSDAEDADEEDLDEAAKCDDEEEDDEEDLEESKKSKKDMLKAKDKSKKKMTESEWLREYVDKIGDIYSQEPAQPEGNEVGAGSKAKVSAKSTVAGKNDMGGQNPMKGGSDHNDPDNKQTPEPTNEYTKGRGKLKGADKFKNVPGGDAGKSSYREKKGEYSSEHGPEGETTGGKVAVSAKSPVRKS